MIPTRIVILTLWLVLPLSAATMYSSPAVAADDKGVFGFFNRSKGDEDSAGGPVHMKPFIGGSAYNGGPGPATQPFNLDPRRTQTKTARFEDSPIHAEAARVRAARDTWIQAETEQVEAQIKKQQAQIRQQQGLLNQQRQAQYLQQASMNGQRRAGSLPAGADPALVDMMKKMYLQNLGVMPELTPTAAGAPPVAPVQQPPAVTEKLPPQGEEKPERRPRHFFNSQQ